MYRDFEETVFDPEMLSERSPYRQRYAQRQMKMHEENVCYLGTETCIVEVIEPRPYYYGLYARSIKNLIDSEGWIVESIREYSYSETTYSDEEVDYDANETVLTDGRIYLKKDDSKYIITLSGKDSIHVVAGPEHEDEVKKIIRKIEEYVHTNNYYKGKNLCFNGRIEFYQPAFQSWDSIILPETMKRQIKQNTLGFIQQKGQLSQFGIPSKRGLILGGEPGTGKTIICNALMSESGDISCIIADVNALAHRGFIREIFTLAVDLSPSIVFVEDIDHIGMDRDAYNLPASSLLELLASMDMIPDDSHVVTVATTNAISRLDKALRERPSRFDRIFIISQPDHKARVDILTNIAKSIPLSEEIIEYIAEKTEGYTPAQLQEIPFGMVITQSDSDTGAINLDQECADAVLAQMNVAKRGNLGFRS